MSKCVINCSGEKVCLDSKELFTSRCSEGNLTDYCSKNKQFIRPIQNLSKINIIIPTYNRISTIKSTLDSILSQNLNCNIIIFLNSPTDIPQNHIDFIHSLKGPNITFMNETIRHGLAEVYQIFISSFLSKVLDHTKNISIKDDRIKEIDRLLNTSLLLFIDDDITIQGSIENAYKKAINNHIIFGDITLTTINSKTEYDDLLLHLMKLFFRFKNDINALTLAPRGAALKKFHHIPNIQLGTDYADQIYFAQINAPIHYLKASTSIDEQDYPGNSHFVKQFRQYFDNSGPLPQIFYNLAKQNPDPKLKQLIQLLEDKDINQILKFN